MPGARLSVATLCVLLSAALASCGDEKRPPPPGGGFFGGAGGSSGSAALPTPDASTPVIDQILTSEPPCDTTSPALDIDGDGYSEDQGDCNDCTVLMNPGAYDFPGNGVDEDCTGTPDDEPVGCDENPELDSPDPFDGAAALGLCRRAFPGTWGLVGARYTLANGAEGMAPTSHGVLTDFGPNVVPRQGPSLLALSSGTARRPGDPGYISPQGAEMNTISPAPPGYPVAAPACPGVIPRDPFANDPAVLELEIQVPTNATRLRFDFNFYTFEFPEFVCSPFNDFFVVLLDPEPDGALLGNISFDSQGNPVSVNNGFVEVCEAQTAGGREFSCSLGSEELTGTGFDHGDGHAATGWLQTSASVPPGARILIQFAIWDAGDHVLDSTVLLDNFRWDVGEAEPPVTLPAPR